MELLIRKLRINYQELVRTLGSGLKFGRNDVKSESVILQEIDETLDEMENSLHYSESNVLHDFFNHKSDANKYLTAEQQEELEREFESWIKSNCYVDSFEKAVEPAIRYLFKHQFPHAKIYVDYSTAELLIGEKCHNLNGEVPD